MTEEQRAEAMFELRKIVMGAANSEITVLAELERLSHEIKGDESIEKNLGLFLDGSSIEEVKLVVKGLIDRMIFLYPEMQGKDKFAQRIHEFLVTIKLTLSSFTS